MVSKPESVTTQTSMAASSSTMASSSTSSSSSVNVMNQPLLLLSNMSNMMTVKLDNTNYIVWKHQITMVLETYSLFELLEEPQLIPDKYLKDLSAMKVWKVLENRFSSISRSHIMNLKCELHNIKKGVDSVDSYLKKIKVVRDKLLAVGVIIDDEELLHIAIKGLAREYNAFRFAIRTRSTQLNFDELSTMLSAEEESLNESPDVKDSVFAMAATTAKPNSNGHNQNFYNNGHNQSFNRGRGRGNYNNRGGKGGRGSTQYPQFNQFQQAQHNTSTSQVSA
nr:hypothetical protein CFP56_66979 [Quercus suber]